MDCEGQVSCEESSSEEAESASAASTQDEQEIVILEAAALHFRRAGSRVEMRKEEEEEWRAVRLVRLFPLGQPERWVSLLDKEGKEIGVLRDLTELAREDLHLVREELRRRYLVPTIQRVLACRDRYDVVEWTVETDRGRVTFLTRHLREKVQEPLPRHLTLTDVEGNRYDIPDLERLDPDSRRLLEERM